MHWSYVSVPKTIVQYYPNRLPLINLPGKVLVHCMMGVSRSATCAIAYLMIVKKMSAVDAIRTVRMRRDIRPNDGFLQQLADLDNELRRERQYAY